MRNFEDFRRPGQPRRTVPLSTPLRTAFAGMQATKGSRMARDALKIKLTQRERELILKYGYPFDELETQLREALDASGRVAIRDGAYWWEQVAGNLAISINEDVEDAGLLEELDELCDAIEYELARHKGRASGR